MSNPTKVFARGKLPFAIVSSSVTTGYAATLSASFAPGYDITNYHQDNYASFENEPAQGPFTETHVGGNQHRHAPLNDGSDTILTRAEVFHINLQTAGEVRLYGPDFFDTSAPRASYLRGNSAKSPLNIGNIQTTTGSNVLGNFTHNYEVAQTQGRKTNNRDFVENEGVGYGELTTQYVTGAQVERTLPERQVGKSVIVERFNAPGGSDVSSRGVLDVEAEEYAPNNTLPFRNQLVRGPLQNLLTAHTEQFGLSSITSGSANFHKVNRNTLQRTSLAYVYPVIPEGTAVTASDAGPTANEFGRIVTLTEAGLLFVTDTSADAGYIYQYNCDTETFEFVEKITEPVLVVGNNVGVSGFASDKFAALGVPEDNSNTGVVHIFASSSGGWAFEQSLVGSGIVAGDRFSGEIPSPTQVNFKTIDINDSELEILVGSARASTAGQVYVFRRFGPAGSPWIETDILEANDLSITGNFGYALARDGNRLIVTARLADVPTLNAGVGYIFEREDGKWQQKHKLITSTTGSNQLAGYSAAISKNTAVIGAPFADPGSVADAGKAHVFKFDGKQWFEETVLTASDVDPSDLFGYDVAVFGDKIAVSAPDDDEAGLNDGAVYIFGSSSLGWIQERKVLGTGDTGQSISNARGLLVVGSDDGAGGGQGQAEFIHLDPQEATLVCVSSSCRVTYDNWHVQHEIPQNDIQYAWISASAITTPCELGGHQRSGAHSNRAGAFTDITFVSQSEVTGNSIQVVDHIGISTPDKTFRSFDLNTNTLSKDRGVYSFDGVQYVGGFNNAGETYAIDLGSSTRWNNIIGINGSNEYSLAVWFRVTEGDLTATPNPRLFDLSNEILFFLTSGSDGRVDIGTVIDHTGGNADYRSTGSATPPGIEFGNWHFAVLTYDGNTVGPSTPPTIYVDAVSASLVENSVAAGTPDNIRTFSNCFVGGRRNASNANTQFGGELAEFSIYDKVLTQSEIETIFSASKGVSPKHPPRPYKDHAIASYVRNSQRPERLRRDSISIASKVAAWYSYDRDRANEVTSSTSTGGGGGPRTGPVVPNVIDRFDFDAVQGTGVTVENYVPINTFSVDNGAFGFSSWKQIRGWENPIVRRLRRNNVVSVTNEPKQIIIPQNDTQLSVKGKRGNGVTNFVEPPVTSKYRPIEHNVILKGTTNPLAGHRIRHTYANNLVCYGNKKLNKRLSLVKREEQMYDRLREFYLDPDFEEEASPINKFLTLTYSEVVYPKEENTYLGKIRGRQNYILDLPGFSENGYDKEYSTHRVFWRDSLEDRLRTAGSGSSLSQSALNSQGFPVGHRFELTADEVSVGWPDYLPIRRSVFPLDKIAVSASKTHEDTSDFAGSPPNGFIHSWAYNLILEGGGELNNEWFFCEKIVQNDLVTAPTITSGTKFFGIASEESQIRKNIFSTIPFERTTNSSQTPDYPRAYHLNPRPKYTSFFGGYYATTASVFDSLANEPWTGSLFDAGLNWQTAELAGKNPWFDSYEDYAQDVRVIGKDCTILPEFRISEHMDYFVVDAGGNFRRQNNRFLTLDGTGVRDGSALDETSRFDDKFFATYSHSDLLRDSDKIRDDHKDLAELSQVTLKCKGVKKLLPYNGFYPVARTVQLANLMSQSIAPYLGGGFVNFGSTNVITGSDANGLVELAAQRGRWFTFLQPFFAPGIMYNTIKAGVAVDFPMLSSSAATLVIPNMDNLDLHVQPSTFQANPILSTNFGIKPTTGYYGSNAIPGYRVPFEAIVSPTIAFKKEVEKDNSDVDTIIIPYVMTRLDDLGSGDRDSYPVANWNHERDFRYELAANNFFGEIPKFFLKEEKLTAFTSAPQNKWKTFETGKSYYMDVIMRKSDDLVMVDSYSSTLPSSSFPGRYVITGALGQRDTGRYFGWPYDVEGSTPTSVPLAMAHTDPSYAPFTPPYLEGEATARIKFSPSVTRKYTLEEIFAGAEVEFLNTGLVGYEDTPAGTGSMNLDASVELFGTFRDKERTFDPNRGNVATQIVDSADPENNRWVISTRMETPVLDFSEQEKVPLTELSFSSGDVDGADFDDVPELFDIGFGTGMWSGYGNIPEKNQGIFLELRESFPQITNKFINEATASLLQAVGFTAQSEKIGQIADKKVISEAIVAIPFLDEKARNTTEIDCKHFIKVPRKLFNLQKQNLDAGEPAVGVGQLGAQFEVRTTSITDMIEAMRKYYIPPQYNFLDFEDIDPFVMYLFEFEHTLDQQDLSDIWQGVMPDISMIAEKDEIEFSHPAGQFEFFQGKPLPKNLRWMIFKVKKKAEKSYFATTADVEDDNRFQFDFEVGRRAPEYSYNWPYDFCSLVEVAKVEVELEYKNDERESKFVQNAPTVSSQELTENARNKRNIRRGGRKKVTSRGRFK